MTIALNTLRSSSARLAAVTVAALIGLAAFSAAAQACSYPDAEQVFAKWGDKRYYELAPDGGLEEGGTGWDFAGGAEVVPGNEEAYLNGESDETSLSLPPGASAISPPVCVSDETPMFRLMARNAGASSSLLKVKVIFINEGDVNARTRYVTGDPLWSPTPPLRLETGNTVVERKARIHFSAVDEKGTWQIDDVYIDPFSRR
jgi:hypothetical protein